jgi:hypothetical protein
MTTLGECKSGRKEKEDKNSGESKTANSKFGSKKRVSGSVATLTFLYLETWH